MTKLVITRGISGSGKSTWAGMWVDQDPQHRAEVNRDHLRMMMHGGHVVGKGLVLDQSTEDMVTAISHSAIEKLLKRGVDVVCSDTNLRQQHARALAKIARRADAEIEVMDFTHVPLETCLERNSGRTGEARVPDAVIRRQYERYIKGLKGKPMPLPTEDLATLDSAFVEYVPGLDHVYIVDIDGTVALKGARNAYDYSRVHEDRPNQSVIDTVHCLYLQGNGIIFLSGREGSDECRKATKEWLDTHVGPIYRGLYMRPEGDFRKDSVVKRELFDQHVRGQFNVRAVFDDRNQVVDMWRNELGLHCYQVAPGDF